MSQPAGIAPIAAISSNATDPRGNTVAQWPPPTLPKQQPAAKQPSRPNAWPSASAGANRSPNAANDQPSRFANRQPTSAAPATPP